MAGDKRLAMRYTNASRETIYLANDPPIIFLSQTGLDSMSTNLSLVKSPYQLGKTSLGNIINERSVTIKCVVIVNDEEDAENKRREIIRAFSPLVNGTLQLIGNTFNRMCENVEVVTTPKFKDEDYKSFQSILEWQVNLIVPGAFITDYYETEFELSQTIPLFEFPLELDEGEWFEVGTLNLGSTKYTNRSDAPAPVTILIYGPTDTPKVSNLTTGEFIQVDTPILANEIMYIDTSFENTSVIIVDENGAIRNAFHYITLDSSFFQVQVGENEIDFEAEAGNDTAKILFKFKRRWIGI